MSDNSVQRSDRHISTDKETIREWAAKHDAVPVRRKTGDTETLRLVPESRMEQDDEQLEWDVFHSELLEDEYVVFYHEETADEPFEVTTHDDAIARSDVEGDQLREQLIEGETVTTTIQETTVVESVVIEEATVESKLVGTELVDHHVVDMELVERECSNCNLVEDGESEHSEWFDTDRYLASLPDKRSGHEMESTDSSTERPSEGIGGTNVERDFPYHAELDVEESWAVTREFTERFTVESHITETDVTETETIEDHDIDVEGLQWSILEQGILGVDHDPEEVMTEYDVETEFSEVDQIETYFERTQVVEDDVVDRMRVRADITSADLTQMEVISEQNLASEMTGEATPGTTEAMDEHSGDREDRAMIDENDTGKAVVDASGHKVGTVDRVEGGGKMMYVDAHSGITERIMSALEWGDDEDRENVIYAEQIAEVTDDEVRLKEHEHLGDHQANN